MSIYRYFYVFFPLPPITFYRKVFKINTHYLIVSYLNVHGKIFKGQRTLDCEERRQGVLNETVVCDQKTPNWFQRRRTLKIAQLEYFKIWKPIKYSLLISTKSLLERQRFLCTYVLMLPFLAFKICNFPTPVEGQWVKPKLFKSLQQMYGRCAFKTFGLLLLYHLLSQNLTLKLRFSMMSVPTKTC